LPCFAVFIIKSEVYTNIRNINHPEVTVKAGHNKITTNIMFDFNTFYLIVSILAAITVIYEFIEKRIQK